MRITLSGSAVAIALTSVNVFVAACGSRGSGEASNVPDASSEAGLSPSATASDAGAISEGGAAYGDDASTSCGVDLPVACPDVSPPAYADVAPIFASRCASCHTGVGGAPWPLATYGDVDNWEDLVQESLDDCSMPPSDAGAPMTVDERMTILRWIACGLPH